MGHAASDDMKKFQVANLKAFDSWLSSNGKNLVPKKDEAVIYAGHDPGKLSKAKTLMTSDPDMSKMWRKIEAINNDVKKYQGQKKYDLLTDVLERCKSTPKLVAAQGPEAGREVARIPNMMQYAKLIGNEKYAYIDKGEIHKLWDKLSGAYVANSEGEVNILEGRTAANKRVTIAFTMVRAELETLWKRKDLPDATKKNAALMIAGLMKYYDGEAQLSEKIVKEAREVMKQARVALKGR